MSAVYFRGVLSGIFAAIVFAIWAINALDDQRAKRGHFEHRGQIYIITPAKPVAR